jgi:hypothetical protein
MSNIWADTFSEIREPFLQEKKEKEETKEKNEKEDNDDKPKRWWDDDGDGVGYEKGEVSDKFPKKKVKKEEVEQIDELSHDTYRSVAKKQSAKVGALQDAGKDDTEAQNRLDRTKRLRKKAFVEPKAPGARNPYAEEVEQIDEISQKTATRAYAQSATGEFEGHDDARDVKRTDNLRKHITRKFGDKAAQDADRHADSETFGRKDPRTGKRQPRPQPRIQNNRTYRTTKSGKMHGQDQAALKRDLIKRRNEEFELWVDSLVKEGYDLSEYTWNDMYEIYSEERDLHSTDKNDKIDVRKGIKNFVNTKPTVSEELEAWIGELLEEGYDLSSFTLEEVAEIYESVEFEQLDEADTYGMPARGDAERQSSDPMAAAKAKAAKAKLAKERAEVQVAQQAQRLRVSATESVLHYVSGRTPLFEGKFDPKKSRLRPASERTQNAMTDAQRKAAKKENDRVAQIHSQGATVLAGLTSSGKRGKVKTTPEPKAPAPEANRRVRGREDKLASAADAVLKNLRNK